jgi:hypothetical protein
MYNHSFMNNQDSKLSKKKKKISIILPRQPYFLFHTCYYHQQIILSFDIEAKKTKECCSHFPLDSPFSSKYHISLSDIIKKTSKKYAIPFFIVFLLSLSNSYLLYKHHAFVHIYINHQMCLLDA